MKHVEQQKATNRAGEGFVVWTSSRKPLSASGRNKREGITSVIRRKAISVAAMVIAGAMLETAQASLVVSGSTIWTSANSTLTLPVYYEVDLAGGLYYYQYEVEVPSTWPNTEGIHALEVDLLPNSGAIVSSPYVSNLGSQTQVGSAPGYLGLGNANVNWTISYSPYNEIPGGYASVVMAFTSPYTYTWGGGSAVDTSLGPWSSQNGAGLVPTPIPEPTTMVAGMLLLLPFGASTLRIVRKNRAA